MDRLDKFYLSVMNKAIGVKDTLRAEIPERFGQSLFQPEAAFDLALWFKRDYMTWIPEVPRCGPCDATMEVTVFDFDRAFTFVPDPSNWTGFKPMPSSRWMTCRKIERYVCLNCHTVRVASRENNPLILIKTREGRCGEHAILFTAFCIALGWRARLVFFKDDDHVITEVFVPYEDLWVPVDPSVLDARRIFDSLLERRLIFKRWGWKLTNIVAYEPYEDPVDVSESYRA